MNRREFASLIACAAPGAYAFGGEASDRSNYRPRPDPESWPIAGNPDLGNLTSDTQEVVDFAVWQALDGTWQLWSCIRNTRTPGMTRLFHGWEGPQLTAAAWKPLGIAQTADPAHGEAEGSMQAPYVVRVGSTWYMFYGSGGRIFLQTSRDGKKFDRWKDRSGRSWLFADQPAGSARVRDPMLMRANGRWYLYCTGDPNDQGVVYARTSRDLIHWREAVVVAFGGKSGVGRFSAECPQVVLRHGRYYLFRTQRYGADAQTMVYRSRDPLMFGINQDEQYYLSTLSVAAPEIVTAGDRDYIAYLEPSLHGIRLAGLEWAAD